MLNTKYYKGVPVPPFYNMGMRKYTIYCMVRILFISFILSLFFSNFYKALAVTLFVTAITEILGVLIFRVSVKRIERKL